MTIDVARVRIDTPGVEKTLHFNNAGAALMPQPVLESVIAHLRLESEIGGYEAAKLRHDAIEDVYAATAEMLNCDPSEIAIVENATRAWDMVFYAIPFERGDRILTAASEYSSNYIAFLQVQKRLGVSVEIIPDDEWGQTSAQALEKMIDANVKLIAITHVPSAGGLVNPAAEIGQVARKAGILYLLDACQSVGQVPIDVQEIGCDFLSATGRKYLRGPRGTGFLYVRRDKLNLLEPPFLDIHSADWDSLESYTVRGDARRFENWETNYSTKIGLAVAIRYALALGIEAIAERVAQLADRFRSRLSDIPGVTVTDLGKQKCGIVTFTVDGHDLDEIQKALNEEHVNVQISRGVYHLLDLFRRGLVLVVRASVHYYNTEEEVDRFCDLLSEIIKSKTAVTSARQ